VTRSRLALVALFAGIGAAAVLILVLAAIVLGVGGAALLVGTGAVVAGLFVYGLLLRRLDARVRTVLDESRSRAALVHGLARAVEELGVGFRQTNQDLERDREAGKARFTESATQLEKAGDRVRVVLTEARAAFDSGRTEVLARLAETGDRLAAVADQLADLVRDVRGATAEDRVEVLARVAQIGQRLERLTEQVASVEKSLAAFPSGLDDSPSADARAAGTEKPSQHAVLFQRLAAHAEMLALIAPRAPMPALGGWSLDADIMHLIARLVWERRPELIVECGSGSSSVWLGYFVRSCGVGRIVALEHDEGYLASSRDLVRGHGLDDVVEIRHAPLEPWSDGRGETYHWYGISGLDDLSGIGLLVVDGPPMATGPQARYPAGPLLVPRCTEDAVIVLDDTNRADEKASSDRWLREWPDLRRAVVAEGAAHMFEFEPRNRGGGSVG
jgi:hypothetical protein